MAGDMKIMISILATNEATPVLEGFMKTAADISKSFQNMSQSLVDFSNAVGPDMTKINSSIGKLVEPLSEDQRSIDELSKSFSEISSAADSASKTASDALSSIAMPLQDDAKDIENITTGLKDMAKEADAAGEAMKKSLAMPSGGTKSEGGGLFGIQGQMDTMYAGMSLGGMALPLDAGIKAAINSYTQFDQAVANVNSMMGLNQSQVEQLKSQLVELSKTVPDGPVALANALYGIVGAGVPANESMQVLTTAAQAATAGQTDLGTATNALIYVMDAYGMSAKDVGKVSDQMFAANAAGAMTFNQFASSIGTVAGAAAQAGVPFDQVAAATAALTNEGLSAQRSTMGLRALLMGIMTPTAGAAKEAKALGIEWDQSALKSKGLTGMLQEAMKATHGNGEELKKLIPNIAAWTVAVDLGGKGAQSYKNAMEQMAQSSGATGRAMQAQEAGTGQQLDKMKASIQTAQIAFVKGFAPAISTVADDVAKLATWFSNLSPQTQKVIGEIAIGTAAFLTIGSAMFMSLSAIGSIVRGFGKIKLALGFAKDVEVATTALEGLTVAEDAAAAGEGLMDALNPVGWIVLAIAAIAALAVVIVTHWKQIKDYLVADFNFLRNLVVSAWNWISNTSKNIWNGITAFFRKWGLTLLATFAPVMGLPILIAKHWNQIVQFASSIWNSVVSTVQGIWNGFITWITTAVQNFLNIFLGMFKWLYEHWYPFQDFVNFIKKMWNTVLQDAQNIWNNIVQFLNGLWNGFINGAKQLWQSIVTMFQNIWNAIQKVATAFWNSQVKFFEMIWNGIVKMATTIFNPIKNFFSGLWNSISSTASSIWNGIRSTMSNLWNGTVTDAENIFNGLGKWFTGLWNQAYNWGANLIHMFAQGVESKVSEVVDKVKSVANSIASFLGFHSPAEQGPGADADKWMPNMMNMFIDGIQSHIPKLQSTLQSALGTPFQGASMMVGHSISQSMVMSGAGAASNAGQVVNVTVLGSVIQERDLVNMVQRGTWSKMKMQGKFS